MSEAVNAVRCEGPCGKIKPFTEYQEHKPGKRRRMCKACFNDLRAGKTHGPGGKRADGKPLIREEKLEAVYEHRLKAENRALRQRNEQLVAELAGNNEYQEVVRAAMSIPLQRPTIKPRERASKLREGTPLVLASDWHVEEEVKPEAVAGRNRYNLDIATKRMERFFEATTWAVRQQRDTFKIRDMILWMGGDFITNQLHDDDAESNQLSPLDALLFWEAEMTAGLKHLLEDDEIEQFIIPCNDGNHGRETGTKRMRNATRASHSLEVFAYAHLALRFADEPRLKFILPTSQFTFLDDVYGRTIRFLHGDVFKYAGGVGGITVPLFRALARWEKVKHADLTCMGHWHQRYCLPDVMINGSLIGYNAYAMGGGFPFEPPVQSLRMLDPQRWCSTDIPLWVSKREDDVMNKARRAA